MNEKTVTRADIVDTLQQEAGLTRQECSNFLEQVLEIVCKELVEDRAVKLARFGNFVVRKKNARVGRNPKTGKEAQITARRVVTFRPSPLMRQRVETSLSQKAET